MANIRIDLFGSTAHVAAPNCGFHFASCRSRLAHFGPNEPAVPQPSSALSDLLHVFLNPLVLILLIAAIASAFQGRAVDAAIIAVSLIATSFAVVAIGISLPFSAEIFLFGVVYINARPDAYVRFSTDFDRRRKVSGYLAIRGFSIPPRLADLDGFALDSDDINSLEECKPGDFEIQNRQTCTTPFTGQR